MPGMQQRNVSDDAVLFVLSEEGGYKMTSHDITFCANSDQCPKAPTCRRAHPPTDVEVSFANFFEEGSRCTTYWPTGEEQK